MQVNMENNSDHFLSDSLEFHTYEEKVDLNDISIEQIAESLKSSPRTTGGKSSAECPVCFVKFTQKNNLSRHMQRFHDVKPPRSHLQSKIDSSSFECSECGMKFTRKSNMLRHMKKFHEVLASKDSERPKIFSCTECDHNFTQWKNCLEHMRNLHSVGGSPKEDVEDQPSLESESNSALEDNMEYVIEVDPFPVISPLRVETISLEPTDLTEPVSSSENQLPESNLNHESESSLKKSSKVVCTECGVWFSTPFNLRRHQKRIHGGKDDILSVVEATRAVKTTVLKETAPADSPDHKVSLRTCHECHVSFSSPFNLRRHMKRVHADLDLAADSTYRKKSSCGDDRLFCPLCTEVSFSTSFNLRRHMKRIHPQNQLETDVAASPADETTRERCAGDSSDENRLSCPLCPEGCVSFSTPSNLRRHMRHFHQQQQDSGADVEEPMIDTSEILKCPRCEYRENRLNLYVHFNLVHGLQVIIEYQVFDSETQLDEWLSQISPEAQFVVRKSDSNRMVISCSQPNRADEFCPAEMVILTESGKCTVHHVKTHVHES